MIQKIKRERHLINGRLGILTTALVKTKAKVTILDTMIKPKLFLILL